LFYLTGYGLGVFIKNFKKAIDYLENFWLICTFY
jgi:hypothetical protein